MKDGGSPKPEALLLPLLSRRAELKLRSSLRITTRPPGETASRRCQKFCMA